jgi:LysM repeat protein
MRDKSTVPLLLLPLTFLLLIHHTAPIASAKPMLGQPASPRFVSRPAEFLPPRDGYAYTIRPGDTLWDIASAHAISVETLVGANTLADPRRLRPGQTIFVPAQPPVNAAESRDAPAAGAVAPLPVEALTETLSLPPEIAGWPPVILSLMNEKRVAQGLVPLAWSSELARAAQAHAEDCAQRNRGSHGGSDGADLRARLARVGYAARYASENWANARSASHAFEMWWNEQKGDDPHRRNILGPRFAEIGIGVARGPWGYYVIADFGGG